MANIFQQQVVPEKPKVLAKERIYVYMPNAGDDKKGLASFNPRDFNAPDGHVSLRWPMEMLVEDLADPLTNPALIKLLEDEFEGTNNTVTLTNPVTGVSYTTTKAELKLRRDNRNALITPDLVLLDDQDFENSLSGDYLKHSIKRKNPLTDRTLVKVDAQDFKTQSDHTIEIKWPYAHNTTLGTNKTSGYGLVKIKSNSLGNLKYDNDGNLEVDLTKAKTELRTKPTYGESDIAKWANRDTFIDANGFAKRDANGDLLLSITKESVGLSDVDNRAFNTRTYSEFGTSMKNTFDTRFNTKLDKATWDVKFLDWTQADINKNTVQKWFEHLELEDNALWESIGSINKWLGLFETLTELNTLYPPVAVLKGANAYVLETSTYFIVRETDTVGVYEWYNTGVQNQSLFEYMETDPISLKPNGPVASVGTSGKWVQSDHVHPSDPTKLNASVFNSKEINITTIDPTADDFKIKLSTNTVNIPFVKTAQFLHNWKSSPNNFDGPVNEYYWAGSQQEFNELDLSTIPNGAILHVEDSEGLEPGTFVTKGQLNNSGLSVSEEHTNSDERFVIIDKNETLDGLVLTLETVGPVGDKGERRQVKAFLFDSLNTSPITSNGHRMAIITESPNGLTLAHRAFTPNRAIASNANGNIDTLNLHPDNILVTNMSDTVTQLTHNRLVRSVGDRTVSTWETGSIANKPIVTTGTGGVEVSTLANNRVVVTNNNGGINTITMHPTNIINTGMSTGTIILPDNKIVKTQGLTNTLVEANFGGVENSLILRGVNDGELKTANFDHINRLLVTNHDGTVDYLGLGGPNQYLFTNAEGIPGWTNGPSVPTHNPQTRLTTNPSESEANGFTGLVAVVLNSAPTDFRNNCMYYY